MCAQVPDAPLFSRPDHADLRARAAAVQREWRADEEEWSRAALEHFRHRRTIVDVLRDAMHRGDIVVIGDDPGAPRGAVRHVGDDWCRVDAIGGVTEVPLPGRAAFVRVVERSPHGGTTGDADAPATWRARLLEFEESGESYGVQLANGETLRGHLRVGADHVVVVEAVGETYVPDAALLRVRPAVS